VELPFERCDLEIEDWKVEPRPETLGDIACMYFYRNAAYLGHCIVSKKNRQLVRAWDREDPADNRERERARRIERLQGSRNPFVKSRAPAEGNFPGL
jgi:deoxyribonuclease-1